MFRRITALVCALALAGALAWPAVAAPVTGSFKLDITFYPETGGLSKIDQIVVKFEADLILSLSIRRCYCERRRSPLGELRRPHGAGLDRRDHRSLRLHGYGTYRLVHSLGRQLLSLAVVQYHPRALGRRAQPAGAS
jgi:hypothetical protein